MGKMDRLRKGVEPFAALFWALGIVLNLPTPDPARRPGITVQYSVESFSTFFRFSKTYTYSIRQRALASHERQSFHIKKITGTLKLIFFFETCRNLPCTSKNNRQK